MERDLSKRIIKTDNLKAFLARRRWQRCGQAIRALQRLKGLSNPSSAEGSPAASPATSAQGSPAASPSSSQVSSPKLGRRAPLAEALITSAKLNLLEEKLKQELDAGRMILKSQEESDKKFKSHVENEQSSSESKDTR